MAETLLVIAILAACLGFIRGLLYGISSIHYQLDDEYLRICVGWLRLRKFPIRDIQAAEVGVRHGVESWGNTLDWATIREKAITLHRRSGLFKRVCFTPDDPQEFVERIRSHPLYTGSTEPVRP